eukprot:TRINITY_DN9442_c0_g1_i4.p1 TRINITY_DN9442_c0_g1~~TRINITY_DN9442_c0_g1_i4.p1  ORF type:complete len:211 (+),score=55.80 TRINITY_DN9442_c0_g1_i4:434-1066(+)
MQGDGTTLYCELDREWTKGFAVLLLSQEKVIIGWWKSENTNNVSPDKTLTFLSDFLPGVPQKITVGTVDQITLYIWNLGKDRIGSLDKKFPLQELLIEAKKPVTLRRSLRFKKEEEKDFDGDKSKLSSIITGRTNWAKTRKRAFSRTNDSQKCDSDLEEEMTDGKARGSVHTPRKKRADSIITKFLTSSDVEAKVERKSIKVGSQHIDLI